MTWFNSFIWMGIGFCIGLALGMISKKCEQDMSLDQYLEERNNAQQH